MFRSWEIKNSKRATITKLLPITIEECFAIHPDERTLPFFQIVTEQVLSDKRYLSLDSVQQGIFWRFIVHVVARNNGLVVRHPTWISKLLSLNSNEWEELENVFINSGLLVVSADGIYLMQHEFREQYLQTLAINNAKRRI